MVQQKEFPLLLIHYCNRPCKHLSAIAPQWPRSRRDGSNRGSIVHIAARFRLIAPCIATRWLWSRRDISDSDAVEVNHACNSDATTACWSRSWQSYSDLSVMILIAGKWSRLQHNFEKSYLQSQGQDHSDVIMISARWSWSQEEDCDRGMIGKNSIRIAILVMKSRSQWHCTYRVVVISITAKIERSWRSESDLSEMIVIAGRRLQSRRQTAFILARWY